MNEERWQRGAEKFTEVVGMPAPEQGADYVADVVIGQVFAEIWTRPGLTRKERRWIAITCACASGAPFAMQTHLGAALRSGDMTLEELQEFVIMFAAYAGHPAATAARAALDNARAQIEQ
jgi:4-carboxymuconolactone decarboxylase